jgi:hypothetical protein
MTELIVCNYTGTEGQREVIWKKLSRNHQWKLLRITMTNSDVIRKRIMLKNFP